ncbi:MAG: hypothetical protein ACE5KM_12405 [Planctomycetaceae bacterium]
MRAIFCGLCADFDFLTAFFRTAFFRTAFFRTAFARAAVFAVFRPVFLREAAFDVFLTTRRVVFFLERRFLDDRFVVFFFAIANPRRTDLSKYPP